MPRLYICNSVLPADSTPRSNPSGSGVKGGAIASGLRVAAVAVQLTRPELVDDSVPNSILCGCIAGRSPMEHSIAMLSKAFGQATERLRQS